MMYIAKTFYYTYTQMFLITIYLVIPILISATTQVLHYPLYVLGTLQQS
jgi:hypothetical protein